MIRGLLFDLDGTLVDSAALNASAYARALGEVGVTSGLEGLQAQAAGRNWRQFLPPILARAASTADPADVARRKQALYADMVGDLRLNDALLALLSACRGAFRIGLVTTASRANVDCIVDRHGLRAVFDLIVTGDDVDRHKPHPQAYLIAAERLGLAPAECLAFEDSDIGLASANAAGMQCIRVAFEAGAAGLSSVPATAGDGVTVKSIR